MIEPCPYCGANERKKYSCAFCSETICHQCAHASGGMQCKSCYVEHNIISLKNISVMVIFFIGLICFSSATYATAGCNDILAWWEFDTSLMDSKNGFTLTNNGATQVSGILGFGYDFENAESDYMTGGDLDNFSFGSSAFSITAWHKPESLIPANGAALVSKDDTVTNQREYLFSYDISNGTFFYTYENTTANRLGSVTSGLLTLNQWQFISMIHDGGTSNVLNVYKNAINASPTPDTSGAYQRMYNLAADFMIGAVDITPTPCCFADGVVDQVVLWNRNLSQSELSTLYNNGSSVNFSSICGNVTPPTFNQTFLNETRLNGTYSFIGNVTANSSFMVTSNTSFFSIVSDNVTKQFNVTWNSGQTGIFYTQWNVSNNDGQSSIFSRHTFFSQNVTPPSNGATVIVNIDTSALAQALNNQTELYIVTVLLLIFAGLSMFYHIGFYFMFFVLYLFETIVRDVFLPFLPFSVIVVIAIAILCFSLPKFIKDMSNSTDRDSKTGYED